MRTIRVPLEDPDDRFHTIVREIEVPDELAELKDKWDELSHQALTAHLRFEEAFNKWYRISWEEEYND